MLEPIQVIKSRKGKTGETLDLRSQKPKGVRNLAKGKQAVVFKYFMGMFGSSSEPPYTLNYMPAKKSQREARKERLVPSIVHQSVVDGTNCKGEYCSMSRE